MLVALLGSIILVALNFLESSSMGSWRRTVAATICIAVLWFVGVDRFFPIENSYPEAVASRIAWRGIEKLENSPTSKYVLLIDGSSVTMHGINGELLEKRLRERGISTTVVQLSLQAANHLERFEILKSFVKGLPKSAREAVEQSKLIFCREVELGYDLNPYGDLVRNQFSGRVLSYLTPRNLPEIARWFYHRFGSQGAIANRDLLGILATSEAYNAFRIGYFQRQTKPFKIERRSGLPAYIPITTRSETFRPSGPLIPIPDVTQILREQSEMFRTKTQWIDVMDQDIRNLMGSMMQRELMFSIPSWDIQAVAYDIWNSRRVQNGLYFSGNSVSIRSALRDPEYWSDEIHLLETGSTIYTEKLSEFIVAQIRSGNL
jgi:hypothetical protein